MTFRTVSSCLIFFAATIGAAHAASRNETFRDWKASLEEVNTGEDVRKTCTASTTAKDTAGKDWKLKLAISNGDVSPPDAYPQIAIAAGGGGLPKGEGIAMAFSFGDKRIDAKGSGDGGVVMMNNTKETSLAVLRAMAAGSTLDLALAGKPAPALSLAGFTAAYRKLGSACGFSTGDVAK